MAIVTVGIAIAKNIFAVHGVDETGKPVLVRPKAKFWLTPHVHQASSTGLNQRKLREAQLVVENHLKEIEDAWNAHFRTRSDSCVAARLVAIAGRRGVALAFQRVSLVSPSNH